MTRINCGVTPEELVNKHLLAEVRELVRIPNCVTKGKYSLKNQPKEFKLGTNHVRFFYDKLLYLKNRYDSLYQECLNRGFNVQYFGSAWNDIPTNLFNDYIPTEKDREIVLERINNRIKEKNIPVEYKKKS